jgi:hypothetical protein
MIDSTNPLDSIFALFDEMLRVEMSAVPAVGNAEMVEAHASDRRSHREQHWERQLSKAFVFTVERRPQRMPCDLTGDEVAWAGGNGYGGHVVAFGSPGQQKRSLRILLHEVVHIVGARNGDSLSEARCLARGTPQRIDPESTLRALVARLLPVDAKTIDEQAVAAEEIVAELTAAALMRHLGLASEEAERMSLRYARRYAGHIPLSWWPRRAGEVRAVARARYNAILAVLDRRAEGRAA